MLAAAPAGTRFDVGAALADALLTERRFPMLFEAPAAAQHQRQAQREALELKQLAREAAQQVRVQGRTGRGAGVEPQGSDAQAQVVGRMNRELGLEDTWEGETRGETNISGTRPVPRRTEKVMGVMGNESRRRRRWRRSG